jgi:hypothetical protein
MPLSLIYTIRDGKGARSTVEINVDVATLANAQTFLTAHAPLLDALILGVIERVGICASGTLPGGLRTTPIVNSDVEEGARFIYNSVGGYKTSVRLPTFNEAMMLSGSQRVDLADADVLAFNVAMTDPLATFSACDYRGADIVSLRSAVDSFQKSRRRLPAT